MTQYHHQSSSGFRGQAMAAVATAIILIASAAVGAEPAIDGLYWTEERDGLVRICKSGDKLIGIIAWQQVPSRDENNPDPELRDRVVTGLTFLSGFTRNAKSGKWEGGRVYSPDNGRTYKGKVWLEESDTLKMRGYIGVSLLGR
ncbi:MAG: DUF2147 domain-containing protein, partial [Pseudomonadota bacterium]